MYESRVSYYSELKGLDLTMGAQGSKPASLIEAAGRRMDRLMCGNALGATRPVEFAGTKWFGDAMTPGISCENCHGDAAQHVRRAGAAPAARDAKSQIDIGGGDE